jgi:dienelactone hydrolase
MRAFPSAAFLTIASLLFVAGCGGPADEPASSPVNERPGPEAPPLVRGDVHVAFAQSDTAVTRVQWGEAFVVRVDGLLPGEEITLRASSKLADGNYRGEATFAADPAGRIDTGTSAPVRGSYDGADADGLVWSMSPTSKAIPSATQYAFHVDVVDATEEVLGGASLPRWYVAPGVTRVPVSSDGLVGAYYAPPGATKLPVIVAFGGSEGGLDSGESAAMYWASRGYAALGLAYFAEKGLPDYLTEVPLEYFEKAFAWLDARPEVDGTKLAVMGGSRGGELALLLGATFPRVRAVIAEVPSGVSWGAPLTNRTETASWTFGGQKLPWIAGSYSPGVDWKTPSGEIAASHTASFRDAIAKATPAALELASIRVEKTNGPILMLAGQDDQLWPSCDLAKIAMQRLIANGHDKRFADASICYPEAGHGSTSIPGVPTALSLASVHPITGELLALGGTAKGTARAQRDAFGKIDAFLAASLKP